MIERAHPQRPKKSLAGAVDEDVLLASSEVRQCHHDDVRDHGVAQRGRVPHVDAAVRCRTERSRDRAAGSSVDIRTKQSAAKIVRRNGLAMPIARRSTCRVASLSSLSSSVTAPIRNISRPRSSPRHRRTGPGVLVVGLLHRGEDVAVSGFGGQQLVMPAPGDDPTMVEQDHSVGKCDGAGAMAMTIVVRPPSRWPWRHGSRAPSTGRPPTSHRPGRESAGRPGSLEQSRSVVADLPTARKPRSPSIVS